MFALFLDLLHNIGIRFLCADINTQKELEVAETLSHFNESPREAGTGPRAETLGSRSAFKEPIGKSLPFNQLHHLSTKTQELGKSSPSGKPNIAQSAKVKSAQESNYLGRWFGTVWNDSKFTYFTNPARSGGVTGFKWCTKLLSMTDSLGSFFKIFGTPNNPRYIVRLSWTHNWTLSQVRPKTLMLVSYTHQERVSLFVETTYLRIWLINSEESSSSGGNCKGKYDNFRSSVWLMLKRVCGATGQAWDYDWVCSDLQGSDPWGLIWTTLHEGRKFGCPLCPVG